MTTNQNSGERTVLLRCPFPSCGSVDVSIIRCECDSALQAVSCNTCACSGPAHADVEESIEAWNARAESALQLRVTSLEGALKHLIEVYDAMGAPRGPSRIMAEATLSPSGPQEA